MSSPKMAMTLNISVKRQGHFGKLLGTFSQVTHMFPQDAAIPLAGHTQETRPHPTQSPVREYM